MATATEVDDFLEHVGVKGMKWGKRKAVDDGSSEPKKPSAGKQKDMDIKAARARINEGKGVVRKLLNADSFGKPLGGREMISLMNKGSSPQDIAIASQMTRGQKAAVRVAAGFAVAGLVGTVLSR